MDRLDRQPGVRLRRLLRQQPLRLMKACIRRRHAVVYRVLQRKLLQVRLIWVELSKDVVELATAIRVKYGSRVPDTLQAACCLQLGPNHLLFTGDPGFRRVVGLKVKLLT